VTIPISGFDHLAITVKDLDAATAFYKRVLGAEKVRDYEANGKVIVRQLQMGGAMFNVHQAGHGASSLVATNPTPGSVDVCFRWNAPIKDAVDLLKREGVEIIIGPVDRESSSGKIGKSVYFRDPDGSLLEFLSVYET